MPAVLITGLLAAFSWGSISKADACEGRAVYKPGYGSKVLEHPQTGVRFSGFQIPYFHDAVDLATRLHRYFYGVHSIGWDIAIRETGPMIIEGNDDWDGAVPMALEKTSRKNSWRCIEASGSGYRRRCFARPRCHGRTAARVSPARFQPDGDRREAAGCGRHHDPTKNAPQQGRCRPPQRYRDTSSHWRARR